MEEFYRGLIQTTLRLGIAAFLLAIRLAIFSLGLPLRLTPGGIMRGAQTVLLIAVAAYCAQKVALHP